MLHTYLEHKDPKFHKVISPNPLYLSVYIWCFCTDRHNLSYALPEECVYQAACGLTYLSGICQAPYFTFTTSVQAAAVWTNITLTLLPNMTPNSHPFFFLHNCPQILPSVHERVQKACACTCVLVWDTQYEWQANTKCDLIETTMLEQ